MTYVYFLMMSNGQVYKGSTDDLEQRIKQHQQGSVSSTKRFLPVKLIGYEGYSARTDALRRERFLKTTEGLKLFKRQYRDIIVQLAPSCDGAQFARGLALPSVAQVRCSLGT